jgi:hypothetical protein
MTSQLSILMRVPKRSLLTLLTDVECVEWALNIERGVTDEMFPSAAAGSRKTKEKD